MTLIKKKKHTALDGLFRYAEFIQFGELHILFDPETQLRAIVAIHNLNRGPAIGGCRWLPYQTADAALEDAMRLARMMSYKAAIHQLNHGGAKAVLMRPKRIKDRHAYLAAYAKFIHNLGGRYITAVDSGTTISDMDIIAEYTPYVTCTTESGVPHDPSPLTAYGVRRGIEAAILFKLKRNSLQGTHVAIQGAGHVGYCLAKELIDQGAKISMCDVNSEALSRCVDELGVRPVLPNEIYAVEADVFAPCALGAILNLENIERLKTTIVAGAANNQLAHQHYAALLHERGILYAPDFVINGGGLIYVAALYGMPDATTAKEQVGTIYSTLMNIFEYAKQTNQDTHTVAFQLAKERLSEVSPVI